MRSSDTEQMVLVVPCSIKDDVVDVLMGLSQITGFSLSTINGYSRRHSHFSLKEQVEGYQSFSRFELFYPLQVGPDIMKALSPVCASAQARYWIMPVIDRGVFR